MLLLVIEETGSVLAAAVLPCFNFRSSLHRHTGMDWSASACGNRSRRVWDRNGDANSALPRG